MSAGDDDFVAISQAAEYRVVIAHSVSEGDGLLVGDELAWASTLRDEDEGLAAEARDGEDGNLSLIHI